MWFEPIKPIKWEDGVLTVRVPSRDYYSRIESQYLEVLKESLGIAFGDNVKLNYQIPDETLRRTLESMPRQSLRGTDITTIQDIEPSTDLSQACLLYTSPSPRDKRQSRMPSSA